MKNRFLSIISLLFVMLFNPLNVYAEVDLNINAKSAILVDVNSGTIIYKLNENERLAPASITKIMTMLLGMEAIDSGKIKLTDNVIISEYASKTKGSTVFLQTGETQTIENLFKAIAIRSANDASVALAEYIAGSEELFVKMMNDRAKELGMENTRFFNASGMPNENHFISAYDVAIMSKELLKYDRVHEWLTTYMTDMNVGKNKTSTQTMVNTNRLIKEYSGANGIKTGSTNEAGFCLSGAAKRENLQLIAVVMGVENSKLRFDEVKRMLDYGFANYDSISLGTKGDIVSSFIVEKGSIQSLDLILSRDSNVLMPKGEKGDIIKEIILPDSITAPIEAGEEIGEMIIRVDGKEIDRVKLLSKTSVKKANLLIMLNRTIKSYLIGK